jgi:hypothetical protein
MLIDIVNVRWAAFGIVNASEDIPGYIEAPATALAYPWKHFIGGHLGRLGTRDDVLPHQQYMADIVENVKSAITKVEFATHARRSAPIHRCSITISETDNEQGSRCLDISGQRVGADRISKRDVRSHSLGDEGRPGRAQRSAAGEDGQGVQHADRVVDI